MLKTTGTITAVHALRIGEHGLQRDFLLVCYRTPKERGCAFPIPVSDAHDLKTIENSQNMPIVLEGSDLIDRVTIDDVLVFGH